MVGVDREPMPWVDSAPLQESRHYPKGEGHPHLTHSSRFLQGRGIGRQDSLFLPVAIPTPSFPTHHRQVPLFQALGDQTNTGLGAAVHEKEV